MRFFSKWLQQWFRSCQRPARQTRCSRLVLEHLEDRLAPTVSLQLVAPPTSSYGVSNSLVIKYTNTSTLNVPAPVVVLSADNANLWLPSDPATVGTSLQMLATSPIGAAGTLAPGGQGSIVVDFTATNSTTSAVNFRLGQLTPGQIINWTALKTSMQPSSISANAWSAVFANFTANVGSTTTSYQAALDADATYLAQLGQPTNDVSQLAAYEINKANDTFSTSALGNHVDAAVPTPGSLSLSFERWFQPGVSGRYEAGSLGLGWTDNWNISASVAGNGNVTINQSGSLRYFALQDDGSYLGNWGDHGVLTARANGYQLTETDGRSTVFNADGTLAFVQDANGNCITATYDASGLLAQLTASNGAYLTFSYSNGLLASVADSTGETTTYTYDATGQYLLSATDAFGTTTYSYITHQTAAAQNALASITLASGSHQYFSYDAEGRLTDTHQDNNQQDIKISYSAGGGYTTTDADGNTNTVMVDDNGQVCESIDALGNVSHYRYDISGDLTALNGPLGSNYVYAYDNHGNLTSATDPLGLTTRFTFDANNNLTSFTDARGNSTRYAYDSSNNLLAVTYANGTQQQYSYDPLGEATQLVNANGTAINSICNAQGLVTSETFADGSSYAYTYDVHGNLLTASSAAGTITFQYQNRGNPDLLTEVDYPNGQSLKFTYNTIGQRIQSVDQTGFTVNYTYDALGRLQELTDGNGKLIVQYLYDAAGNLIQQNNGNGASTVYTYDRNGDVLSITNYAPLRSAVNSFDVYTYDALGDVLTETNQDGKWVYAYDADSQLTGAVFTPNSSNPDKLTGQNLLYVYDAAGNRILQMVNGVTTTYVANNVNEYTSSTANGVATSYRYDNNGNLISQTAGASTTTFRYDGLDELIGVNGPNQTAAYTYDPLGNRNSQTVNGVQTQFLIDPENLGDVVSTYGASGSLLAHYTYGFGLASQVGASGSAGFYDFNLAGNTIGITGASGRYVNKYSYLPFGQSATLTAALANPFTFGGQGGVMQDSSNLFNMRAREYAPLTGQFLSNDPLGLAGADSNLRRYVTNNPLNAIDPAGTKQQSVQQRYIKNTLGKAQTDRNMAQNSGHARDMTAKSPNDQAHLPTQQRTYYSNQGIDKGTGHSKKGATRIPPGFYNWPKQAQQKWWQQQEPKQPQGTAGSQPQGNHNSVPAPQEFDFNQTPVRRQHQGDPTSGFDPDLAPVFVALAVVDGLSNSADAGTTSDTTPSASPPPLESGTGWPFYVYSMILNPVTVAMPAGGSTNGWVAVANFHDLGPDAGAYGYTAWTEQQGSGTEVPAKILGNTVYAQINLPFSTVGTRTMLVAVWSNGPNPQHGGVITDNITLTAPATPVYTTQVASQIIQTDSNDPPLAVIDTTDPHITSASQVSVSTGTPSSPDSPFPLVTGITLTRLANGVTQIVIDGVVSTVQPGAGLVFAAPLQVTLAGQAPLTVQLAVDETASAYIVNPTLVTASAGQPVLNVQVATVAGPASAAYTGVVSWGDGDTSPAQFTPIGGDLFSVTASKPTPYAAAGSYAITVTVKGPGDVAAPSARTTATVSAAAVPTVTSISTKLGALAGGTWVVITGTNLAGASAVKFGNTAATSIVSATANQIVAISPAGATGVVNVTVVTAGGASASSAVAQFTYVGAASLSRSTVTISSTNLQAGATATVTLTARDAAGYQEPVGGLTVGYTLGTGAGRGLFSNVIDNGDGTYTATFTGTTAGQNTFLATINGASLALALPILTVVPVVTASMAPLANIAPNIIINGFGFSTIAANNLLLFSNGVKGVVVAASANQLTVRLLTALPLGELFAIVTTNGVSSGSAVPVALVSTSGR